MEGQRNLVQWLFNDDTRIGDIKRFNLTKGGYVVAQLTGITREGSINIDAIKEEVMQEIPQKERRIIY